MTRAKQAPGRATLAQEATRDERANSAKAVDLQRYGVPCYWLVISPVEAQALVAGVVSTEIMKQAATLLTPDIETSRWHPRQKLEGAR